MIDKKTCTVRKSAEKQTVDADVCMAGADAGLMAALTAARLGRRTILLDAMPTWVAAALYLWGVAPT